MALKTKIGNELPEGAVEVKKEEALKYQWEFIKNWPSEIEVLTLKFGKDIAAATTCFSSIYIINYFRKVFLLRKARYILPVLPGVIIPTILTHQTTDKKITNPIILMKLRCPICDQIKFACVQYYSSLMFPTFYGYMLLSSMAAFSKSYQIPHLQVNPKEFWRVTLHIFKQAVPHLQLVGLFNTVLILFLPYLQNKQIMYVMAKAQQNEVSRDEELLTDV